jgi:hypothetical protein
VLYPCSFLHHKAIILNVILASIMISCRPTTYTQEAPSSSVQDVQVNTATPTDSKVRTEEFTLPNCGGTGELHQTLGSQASVSKSETISTKATVRGGGEVDIPETVKLKLEVELERAYQKTFESASSRLDAIDMPAAAGTHVVYVIDWYNQNYESIIEYSTDGKVYEVPYVYMLQVPKIESSYQISCNILPPTSSNEEPSTNINVLTTRPLPNDLGRLDNIWSLASFRDPKIPSTLNYSVKIKHEETYSVNFGQCAMDSKQLTVILQSFNLVFYINDNPIPNTDLLEYDVTTKDGWPCNYWATVLSNWTPNSTVKLEIFYEYSKEIYDGENFYAPGEYKHIFNITVK